MVVECIQSLPSFSSAMTVWHKANNLKNSSAFSWPLFTKSHSLLSYQSKLGSYSLISLKSTFGVRWNTNICKVFRVMSVSSMCKHPEQGLHFAGLFTKQKFLHAIRLCNFVLLEVTNVLGTRKQSCSANTKLFLMTASLLSQSPTSISLVHANHFPPHHLRNCFKGLSKPAPHTLH